MLKLVLHNMAYMRDTVCAQCGTLTDADDRAHSIDGNESDRRNDADEERSTEAAAAGGAVVDVDSNENNVLGGSLADGDNAGDHNEGDRVHSIDLSTAEHVSDRQDVGDEERSREANVSMRFNAEDKELCGSLADNDEEQSSEADDEDEEQSAEDEDEHEAEDDHQQGVVQVDNEVVIELDEAQMSEEDDSDDDVFEDSLDLSHDDEEEEFVREKCIIS